MGCCSGKGKDSDKKIPFEMEQLKQIEKIDNIFSSLSSILENAEKIRSGIDDSRETMIGIAQAWRLKDPNSQFLESVNAFFICMLANMKKEHANITDVFEFTEEAPFVQYSRQDDFSIELNDFAQALETYVKTVGEAPKTLLDLSEQAQTLQEQLTEISKTIQEEIKGANLDMAAGIRFSANFGKNTKTAGTGIGRLGQLKETANNAKNDMSSLIKNMETTKKVAKEKASEAKKAKHMQVNACLINYAGPDKFLPPVEQAKIEKIENKKKKKEEKKGE